MTQRPHDAESRQTISDEAGQVQFVPGMPLSVGFPLGLLPEGATNDTQLGVIRLGSHLHRIPIAHYQTWLQATVCLTQSDPTFDDDRAREILSELTMEGLIVTLQTSHQMDLSILQFHPCGAGLGLSPNGRDLMLCSPSGVRLSLGPLLYHVWANSGRLRSLSEVCDAAASDFALPVETVALHFLTNLPALIAAGVGYLDSTYDA